LRLDEVENCHKNTCTSDTRLRYREAQGVADGRDHLQERAAWSHWAGIPAMTRGSRYPAAVAWRLGRPGYQATVWPGNARRPVERLPLPW
jgi:hypothetical protein